MPPRDTLKHEIGDTPPGQEDRLLTSHEEFLVASKQRTHLWLQVIHGADQGIRVSIPLRHSEYDDELQDHLSQLSEKQIISATLASPTNESPNWRVKKLEREP